MLTIFNRLCKVPTDSGEKLDIVTWNLNCDWPFNEDDEYLLLEKQLQNLLDDIIKSKYYVRKILQY